MKEQLRRLLKTGSLTSAHTEKMHPGVLILASRMTETDRLWNTVCAWWPEIEVLVVTDVTNDRVSHCTSRWRLRFLGGGWAGLVADLDGGMGV